MRKMVGLCLFAVVLFVFTLSSVKAVSNYYFSVDIGSDWEMSDPNTNGNEQLDPGDIYSSALITIKDDALIFKQDGGDPAPPNSVLIGTGDINDYVNYFDMDGEDQLSTNIEVVGEGGIEIDASAVAGLWKDPDELYVSYDDDQAIGWAVPASDVPVTSSPSHGKTNFYDEILLGTTWKSWSPLIGVQDEAGLGLISNPTSTEEMDDDVDALDIELHRYWYWSCDSEANYNLDPGAIYVTDRTNSAGGFNVAVSQAQLGLVDDPATSNITEDADIDGFEFCTTDDTNIIQHFGLQVGNEYLTVVFSVDQDDPLTGGVNESGGLDPKQLYISLLTGDAPMQLGESYSEDIDAVAFWDEEESLDFGDAPNPYPTLLSNNGARHIAGGPYLGAIGDQPDIEVDGQPEPNALGDDNDGNNDENGVWFPLPPAAMVRGVSNTVKVVVSGTNGYVSLWVDWNGNGSWAETEDSVFSGSLNVGTNFIPILSPTNAVIGKIFSRCRISTQSGIGYSGSASDGEVEDNPVWIDAGTVDWCNLQWPYVTTSQVGVAIENIYGRVYHTNITDSLGQGAGLIAALGYGPDGTDPTTNAAIWTWVSATYNQDYGNQDEYMATLTIPVAGRYDYAYRYSRNGGVDWTYGDLDSNTNGYTVPQAGDLLVQSRGDEDDNCSKWLQLPDCDFGLDLPSFLVEDGGGTNMYYRLADDWLCDGRPITAIRWWGSYIGNNLTERPSPAPVAFILRWYTNVPTNGATSFAHPGGIIKEITVPLASAGAATVPAGFVEESPYCLIVKGASLVTEQEFEYYLELKDPWVEKEGNLYWLNIEAVYNTSVSTNEWGWATSSEYDKLSDAVVWEQGMPPGKWTELTWTQYPWDYFFNDYGPFVEPANEPSLDLAFEILTDVCPSRCKKWEQPPNMLDGQDKDSWREDGQSGDYILRADDWICDGRPVSDIHWWGSYIGWKSNEVGSITNPIPWPTNANARLLGFDLSWHQDDSCLPFTPALTNIFVPITNCYEVFYGSIPKLDGTFEHEYQYYVDLLNVDGPWNEVEGTHYWLNIQAVVPQGFQSEEAHYNGWGWLTTFTTNLCSSVKTINGTNWGSGEIGEGALAEPYDLAYELTTTEVPGTNSPFYKPVRIIEFDIQTNNIMLVSTGGCSCGVQVLQESTNLLDNPIAWDDVATNMIPNTLLYNWYDYVTNDILFYRILLKNN